jgi:hypothetical protein
MTGRVILVLAMVLAIACGWAFADSHYRLSSPMRTSDQLPLAHRDSAYTSSTWVVSDTDNYLQLRFFDRVEGGIWLRPSWGEVAATKGADGAARLPHLVPATPVLPEGPVDPLWPAGKARPDPGPVNNSPYISLFPFGVLMNKRVMAAANDDPAAASPRILIVGLGSGIGIANLAYHFPQASITVVDIDGVVRDLVMDHYPLLRWLTTQTNAKGEPRLSIVVEDARRYIRYEGARRTAAGTGWDLIILDAYTAGSTIPPHLMTREFFASCREAGSEGGIVFANVIGSYGKEQDGRMVGEMHRTVGGAIRTFRAAGLVELWNFPIIHSSQHRAGAFAEVCDVARNNIVICSTEPVDPVGNKAGWERIARFVPFADLPVDRWVSSVYVVYSKDGPNPSTVPAAAIDAALPQVEAALKADSLPADTVHHQRRRSVSDHALAELVRAEGQRWAASRKLPLIGWDVPAEMVIRLDTDAVMMPREVVRVARLTARDATVHSGEALTGPADPPGGVRAPQEPTWAIRDAPLFTDDMPNADIWNR